MRQSLGVLTLIVLATACSADVADATKKLGSSDNSVRRQAALELSEAGADARPALAALVKALAKDDDRFVRTYAARALGNIADPKASVPALAAALNDGANGVRLAAIKSLAKMGPDAIPALGKAVLTGAADLKEPAVTALAKLGKPAFTPLVDIVKTSKVEAAYRRLALAGLMKLGDDAKPALAVLTTTAKKPGGAGQDGQQLALELYAALGALATKSDADAVALLDGIAKQEKGNAAQKKAAAAALKKIQSR